ncbi:hypothetical protein Hanom_Chr10g00936531 [Helianthus anomalus]
MAISKISYVEAKGFITAERSLKSLGHTEGIEGNDECPISLDAMYDPCDY